MCHVPDNWEPQGETMHERMLELIRRYIDSGLQQTRGMQGMMARDAAGRMYPRIENVIRGMSEEDLKNEIGQIQSQMRKVLGESAQPTKKTTGAKKGKGPKAAKGAKAKRTNAAKSARTSAPDKTPVGNQSPTTQNRQMQIQPQAPSTMQVPPMQGPPMQGPPMQAQPQPPMPNQPIQNPLMPGSPIQSTFPQGPALQPMRSIRQRAR